MANGILTQYDPAQVQVNIAGKTMTGFAAGTFIEVERETDAYTKSVGADGEVTRVKSQNFSGSFKLTLVQGSPSNDILSGLATQDEQTSDQIFPILVKDSNGTTIAQGAKCWIKKKPSSGFAVESENREWNFDTSNLSYTVGGGIQL